MINTDDAAELQDLIAEAVKRYDLYLEWFGSTRAAIVLCAMGLMFRSRSGTASALPQWSSDG